VIGWPYSPTFIDRSNDIPRGESPQTPTIPVPIEGSHQKGLSACIAAPKGVLGTHTNCDTTEASGRTPTEATGVASCCFYCPRGTSQIFTEPPRPVFLPLLLGG